MHAQGTRHQAKQTWGEPQGAGVLVLLARTGCRGRGSFAIPILGPPWGLPAPPGRGPLQQGGDGATWGCRGDWGLP